MKSRHISNLQDCLVNVIMERQLSHPMEPVIGHRMLVLLDFHHSQLGELGDFGISHQISYGRSGHPMNVLKW